MAKFFIFFLVTFLVFFIVPFIILNISLIDIVLSIPNLFSFLANNFFPANFAALEGNFTVIKNTILFAIVGTVISSTIAFFLAILMSRSFNKFLFIRILVKFIASFFRNVPIVVWASILVFIFGIGPLVGVIALVLGGIGFLARSYSETIDEIYKTKLESLKSTGASYFQIIFHGLFPLFIKPWLNLTLFALEINVRLSAILGMVGAGGLGLLISANLDLRNFRRAMALIIVLIIIVLVTEFLTNKLREYVEKDFPYFLLFLFIIAIYLFSVNSLNISLNSFLERASGAPRIISLFMTFNIELTFEILNALFISILLAIAGLGLGVFVSFFLSFLSAKNTAPIKILAILIKTFIAILRAIPSLIIILMAVSSLGFGEVSAVIGITFSSLGYLTKVFTATIEEENHEKIEALKSTGASYFQVIYHGILPRTRNSFMSWISLRLEANISDGIALGVVSAGGIGTLMARAIRIHDFEFLSSSILIIFVFMLFLEFLTSKIKSFNRE